MLNAVRGIGRGSGWLHRLVHGDCLTGCQRSCECAATHGAAGRGLRRHVVVGKNARGCERIAGWIGEWIGGRIVGAALLGGGGGNAHGGAGSARGKRGKDEESHRDSSHDYS